MKNIVLIGGDGIGPEVVSATRQVLSSLFPNSFTFTEVSAGFEHFRETGETISESDLELCREADAVLYGANTNPPDEPNYKSLTLTLRRELGLFANVRPAKSFPEISPFSGVDLVIVRENSEGLYIRDEEPFDGGFIAKRRITESASRRIIHFACELARREGRERVTLVHKANVLKKTCGLFRQVGLEVAEEYPELLIDERLVDAMAMELVIRPQEFEVLVTTNLFGDILSDEASGLVGGLGVSPGANIGEGTPVFEPVHGSAPDLAGQGIANPLGMLLSAKLMLSHFGEKNSAELLDQKIQKTLATGHKTKDLAGTLNTEEFVQALLDS